MKSRILPAALALMLTLTLDARADGFKPDLELSAGYRVDQFKWNIAGDVTGSNPNVLSEYTWRDLETFQVRGGLRVLADDAFYLRASLSYGWIFEGVNQDSDFAGDHRTLEFSRSNNRANKGSTLDGAMGFGYQFRSGRIRWIPLLGYSYSEQNLTLKDGCQTISVPVPGVTPPPVGPIAGLNSAYDAAWKGPWVGFDLFFAVQERLTLFGVFQYHWSSYEAVANLNLRADLAHPKSFEHHAEGVGYVLAAGAEYAVKGPWIATLKAGYERWSTDPGMDRIYYADGSVAETRLNEVKWRSFALMLGLTYRFASK